MSAIITNRNPINIGVVGVGHMGRYHVNLLTKILPNENIYIYDIDVEKTNKMAQEYKINACPTYDELLDAVDAVVVVVPTILHYEYVMKALTKECHVLVEKPISNNLEHAQEMMNYAKQKNLILHIGHVERFNGAVQAIRSCIKDPFYFQTQRVGSVSRITDVGVVLDLMIHDIDLILSFVDSPVIDITAYGASVVTDFEDYAIATLYFENGVIASLVASRVSTYKARSMTISQKDSHISLDYATNDLVVYRNQDLHYDVSQEKISYTEGHVIDRVFVHKDNPLKLELEYFLDDIYNDVDIDKYKNITWDSHSNIHTMEVAFKILEQINKHKKS